MPELAFSLWRCLQFCAGYPIVPTVAFPLRFVGRFVGRTIRRVTTEAVDEQLAGTKLNIAFGTTVRLVTTGTDIITGISAGTGTVRGTGRGTERGTGLCISKVQVHVYAVKLA